METGTKRSLFTEEDFKQRNDRGRGPARGKSGRTISLGKDKDTAISIRYLGRGPSRGNPEGEGWIVSSLDMRSHP